MYGLTNVDYLPPQLKEIYDALIQTGQSENAQSLLDEHTHAACSGATDYLVAKRKTVYNLWIHQVARALEENMCQKASMPCTSCVQQARNIGCMLWALIFRFLHDLKPRHWGTPWEMLDIFQKILEAKNTAPLLPPVKETPTPRIVKAPTLEAQNARDRD